jgi:hypothetical protein
LFPHEQKVESIEQAKKIAKTRFFWIVNYLSDYDDFDFLWEPVPWESKFRHVWPSQWQEHGGTELIPKDWDGVDTKYHTEPKISRQGSVPAYIIDYGNGQEVRTPNNVSVIRTVRYVNSYLDTIRRIVFSAKEEHIWILSSLCNYDIFTFTWHPSEWQQDLIHVFASNDQKFGDTFYLHVPTARKVLDEVTLLDYANLNFVEGMLVLRHRMPTIEHNADTHVQVLKLLDPQQPFTLLHTVDDPRQDDFADLPTISVWDKTKKTVMSLNQGSSAVIVPREIQSYVKNEIYEYPYISKINLYKQKPLPIIFLSNNEQCADENWQDLCDKFSAHYKLIRVHGIKGRVQSQLAAAKAADSPWYFVVPAKIKIHDTFNFKWQPDRLQQPKHYIFDTYNPVTELSYGHMGMVCYCRSLVEQTKGDGLDFTLESAHEVTGIEAGVATLDHDSTVAWRTAFREVTKLQHYYSVTKDIDTEYRLSQWTTVGNAATLSGAKHAQEFYHKVNGNIKELLKTYEWSWIDDQYSDVLSQL